VTVKPAVRKITPIEALPVARYWQSRHQQARATIGGWSKLKRTAPQKQRPVMGVGIPVVLPTL
jgi:hypothetical protein